MNGPGVAFAEQVRFVTVAGEVTAAGFGALGRRALAAEREDDRRQVTEASRHLGEVVERWAALSPDAVGLRMLADEVRGNLAESAEFTALTQLFDDGSLREVTFGLVTALRSTIADLRDLLSPTADRAFDLALGGIDTQLEAARNVLDCAATPGAAAVGRFTPGALRSPDDDGSRTAELARTILIGGRKDFSSPLGVSKLASLDHLQWVSRIRTGSGSR